MKVNELYKILNEIAPFDSACSWDNVGHLIGDGNMEISGVYITLDADMYALTKAIEQGCNIVVSHHPIIFSPIKSVTDEDISYHYIKNGVAVISSHTCLDMAKGGICELFAKKCGLENIKEYFIDGMSLARAGEVKEMSGFDFADMAKKSVGTKKCDCVIKRPANKILAVCGSGGSCVYDAYKGGFDTLVTGEAKHDAFVLADSLGINLIALGHFETENVMVDIIYDRLCIYLK